jgi:ribosomal protein L37AE/L43A
MHGAMSSGNVRRRRKTNAVQKMKERHACPQPLEESDHYISQSIIQLQSMTVCVPEC